MKKILRIISLLLCFACEAAESVEAPFVKQAICYDCADAREVYLVWGLDNWQLPQKNLWPAGSFLKGGLLYSPMFATGRTFTQQLKVPAGSKVDYVFWITRGPRDIACDVWDLNRLPQEDYHSLAINDNTTLIRSNVRVSSKQQLSIVHYGRNWLAAACLLALVLMLVRKNKLRAVVLRPGACTTIAAGGTTLLLLLFCARVSASGLGWELYHEPARVLPKILWAGYYDYLYVTVLTVFFVLLAYTSQRFPLVRKSVTVLFCTAALLSALAALLNIQVLENLGKPFNMRWFYYSDFLNSSDARAALSFNLSPSYLLNLGLVLIGAALITVLLVFTLELLIQKFRFKKIMLAATVAANIAYVMAARGHVNEWSYDRLANPVVAFAESLSEGEGHPKLYSMEVADSLRFEKPGAEPVKMPAIAAGKIQNVLMVVLESTPAEYVQPYARKYKVTPELDKYAANAIVFRNMYAHAPATNKSLVSILASVYPWLSYNSITNEFPDAALPTISAELKKRQYRTAFFNSGDNRFQKTGEFLAHRGFDVVRDCREVACPQYFEEKDQHWGPLDGVNDECTARALRSWMQEQRGHKFFAMLWTYQTHYPYYSNGGRTDIETYDSTLNRYLNAVHHSDQVMGRIIEGLKEDGLFDSTLVVVVGDHGEAFGRHGQTTHASMIYEENVHIPCLFINPALHGERNDNIGGLADLAPTILGMLGLQPAKAWQGQNLFALSKARKTYFFCPWSDYLYGYREGDLKYIYNATKDATEIYDLKNDPFEEHNLATAEKSRFCHQKLAAWVQMQDKFMKQALQRKKR
jgi:lipoteichoic acid synthase